MNTDALVFCIKNTMRREDFMRGLKGEYLIYNLDFSKIEGMNFNDGNNYTFINCILEDVNVQFENEEIVFYNCKFGGKVTIHNHGVGKKDLVFLEKNIGAANLCEFDVCSPNIECNKNDMSVKNKLNVTADSIKLVECQLRSPNVLIEFNSSCDISCCSITRINQIKREGLKIEFSFVNAGIVYKEKEEASQKTK